MYYSLGTIISVLYNSFQQPHKYYYVYIVEIRKQEYKEVKLAAPGFKPKSLASASLLLTITNNYCY